ncbi:stage VI sporulation protein D [Bacillaceae bacterium S4-13-58]
MSFDEPVFRFSMDESLWFKRGQEVDELMGISLEPDISIQEMKDHVSVRGVIRLEGEYFPTESEEVDQEQQVLSFRDHGKGRVIEHVDEHDDGISEFTYAFPVEITIPKYRVPSLDDVLISVESFDYEIPERSQIKLKATVAIEGILAEAHEEQKEEEVEEPREEERVEEPREEVAVEQPREEEIERADLIPEPQWEESFDVDELVESPPEKPEFIPETPDLLKSSEEVESSSSEELVDEEESSSSSEEGRFQWQKKKTQTFAEFFGKKESPEKVDMEESVEISHEEVEDVDDSDEYMEMEERKSDAGYLTKMLRSEGESRSSMKMCIVQPEETLDQIAERYGTTISGIVQANRLTSENVASGQILYIPK